MIQDSIMKNLEPLHSSWRTDIVHQSKYRYDPLADIIQDYVAAISSQLIQDHRAINKKSDFKFTYTAMHGVGYKYVQKLFDEIGVQIIPVVEQVTPDPEFPTVKYVSSNSCERNPFGFLT